MDLGFAKPDIGIHVFIDEAGDHGIKPLQPNGTPKGSGWLILGAVAVNANKLDQIEAWCATIRSACGIKAGHPIHYVKLDSQKRQLACEILATLPLRCFVFCSHKENMRGHKNDRAARASKEKNYYFHSCAKYLLERISEFGLHQTIKEHGTHKHLSITFDKNEMVPFSRLRTYLDAECKRIEAGLAFHQRRPMKTQVMNMGAMRAQQDHLCAGLQLADLVAGAFHDATQTRINTKPAKSLKHVMWTGKSLRKIIENNGVTLFPPYKDSNLTSSEKEIFEFFGYSLN